LVTPQVVENILQALVAGLLAGAIYGLMCVGLGLIFGVMGVINFAQGDFMMLGMYAAYYLFLNAGIRAGLGNVIGPYVAILLSAPLLFLFGFWIHKLLISRVTGARTARLEGDGQFAQLILTLGVALVLQNGGLIVFGSVLASIRTPLSSSAWEIGPLWGDFVSIFVNKARGIAALISIAAMLALTALITRTRFGKTLRAAADNPVAATYMGIDYVIVMYAGVVLGGMGSITGAFWGGMTIGLVQQLSTLVLPTQLQNAAIFVVFLLIIFLRPQGLFGRVVERT
jgi:branched-chain amino acid transport system permease protein